MTKERCAHIEHEIVDLVDRFQNWRGYQCPYCEIDRLKKELEHRERYWAQFHHSPRDWTASSSEAAPVVAPVEPSGVVPHHVQYDRLGWLCSMCGGWNNEIGVICSHDHSALNRGAKRG